MNLKEINELINNLRKNIEENRELLAFYEHKKEELTHTLNSKIGKIIDEN